MKYFKICFFVIRKTGIGMYSSERTSSLTTVDDRAENNF